MRADPYVLVLEMPDLRHLRIPALRIPAGGADSYTRVGDSCATFTRFEDPCWKLWLEESA